MYYKIVDNVLEHVEKMPEEVFLSFMTMPELEAQRKMLGLPLHLLDQLKNIDTTFRSSMQIQEGYLLGTLTTVDVNALNKNRCQIALLFHKRYYLIVPIVDEEGDMKGKFQHALQRYKEPGSLEKVLYAFFDALLAGATESLEKMEKQMVIIEHELVQDRIDASVNKDLFRIKKQLFTLRNYYEELIDLAQVLEENELEVFDKSQLHYFYLFANKAKRMSESVKEEKEGLLHLKEALDASLEYNINHIMKVFTVVTTVFLPLTLIVGWYGMNFRYMPELNWKYGYVFVVVLSVAVVVCCLSYFHKKRLL